ncbi:MAG: hypothetical protein ACE5JI_13890 [Acidobacteriota bacterium]
MKILAVITEPHVFDRVLSHLQTVDHSAGAEIRGTWPEKYFASATKIAPSPPVG